MKVAKIAISAAGYWLDKPYDYAVPDALSDAAVPGVRVTVPFGRGNHRSEGVYCPLLPTAAMTNSNAWRPCLTAAPC